MLSVKLITDPFNLESYSETKLYNCDIITYITSEFESWPSTARLYSGAIAVENDVTPRTEIDINNLKAQQDGAFIVVIYPGDPVTAIIVGVVALVALTAIMFLLMPKIPSADNNRSSTNTIGARSNKARPNERILDNFGNVIVVLELLAVPYSIFENNLEVEIAYMCVGRGSYNISGVKDGDTPINQIAGAGAVFYGPNTSPNSGSPSASFGSAIGQPLRTIVSSNDVNGQILQPPNSNRFSGDDSIRFVYPDTIQQNDSDEDFTDYFGAGDVITIHNSQPDVAPGSVNTNQIAKFTLAGEVVFESFDPSTLFFVGRTLSITNAAYAESDGLGGVIYVDLYGEYLITAVTGTTITLDSPSSVNPDWSKLDDLSGDETQFHSSTFASAGNASGYNVDGTYNVVSVTNNQIVLSNPGAINSSWNNLADLAGGASPYGSATLSTSSEHWVGPFVINLSDADEVIANFVALQGMYQVTKKGKQKPYSATVQLEVMPVDSSGAVTGAATYFSTTLAGVKTNKDPVGKSIIGDLPQASAIRIRARRTSPTDLDYSGTIVDEVKWRNCYAASQNLPDHFGDVTTCFSRTVATNGATSVKERKLNCRALRRVLVRNPDNTLGPGLVATSNIASIFCHAAVDPYIGGRQQSELDVQQIFDTVSQVVSYFGISAPGTFNGAFDQLNTSFEEMGLAISLPAFCTPYRQGSKLYFHFEREAADSVILFNHRNKVPGTEKRTHSFGMFNDNDGVEFDWIDPNDGSTHTIYVPEDRSAVKPKKISVQGVQSESLAYLHSYRAYNKMKYQNCVSSFSGLSEASQLLVNSKVRNADNTNPKIDDGNIVSVSGLTLELSQPFTPVPGTDYVIWIQINDAVMQFDILPGSSAYHVVLQSAPPSAIVVNEDAVVDITYQIVSVTDIETDTFLLSEKGEYDRSAGTIELKAINYDSRYYDYDLTYKDL